MTAAGGMAPITSISRRDAVMREVRRAIILGQLKPGDRLTELQLAATLNVSRPTIREALSQLSQEGLLVPGPYRSLRVADLDAAAINDLARTRVALDVLAVEGILEDTTGRRRASLRQGWTEYERVAFDPDPLIQHDAHVAFHRNIWVASENAMLVQLWPVTEAHMTVALAQDQATRDDPRRAHAVHRSLMDALETGDLKRIKAAFIAHTIDSADELVRMLGRKGATQ